MNEHGRIVQPRSLAAPAASDPSIGSNRYPESACGIPDWAGGLPLRGHQTAESAEQGRLEPRLATANICIPLPTGHDNLRASCSPVLQTGT